jgi:hypothetical protein
VDRHCVGRISHEAHERQWQANIIEGVPIFLSQSRFRLVLGGLLLAAYRHRFPFGGVSGHRVQYLPVGTTGRSAFARSSSLMRIVRALIMTAGSVPDEINRRTDRLEMASRSAASSKVISFPTLCSPLLIAASYGWFMPADDDSGTGAR